MSDSILKLVPALKPLSFQKFKTSEAEATQNLGSRLESLREMLVAKAYADFQDKDSIDQNIFENEAEALNLGITAHEVIPTGIKIIPIDEADVADLPEGTAIGPSSQVLQELLLKTFLAEYTPLKMIFALEKQLRAELATLGYKGLQKSDTGYPAKIYISFNNLLNEFFATPGKSWILANGVDLDWSKIRQALFKKLCDENFIEKKLVLNLDKKNAGNTPRHPSLHYSHYAGDPSFVGMTWGVMNAEDSFLYYQIFSEKLGKLHADELRPLLQMAIEHNAIIFLTQIIQANTSLVRMLENDAIFSSVIDAMPRALVTAVLAESDANGQNILMRLIAHKSDNIPALLGNISTELFAKMVVKKDKQGNNALWLAVLHKSPFITNILAKIPPNKLQAMLALKIPLDQQTRAAPLVTLAARYHPVFFDTFMSADRIYMLQGADDNNLDFLRELFRTAPIKALQIANLLHQYCPRADNPNYLFFDLSIEQQLIILGDLFKHDAQMALKLLQEPGFIMQLLRISMETEQHLASFLDILQDNLHLLAQKTIFSLLFWAYQKQPSWFVIMLWRMPQAHFIAGLPWAVSEEILESVCKLEFMRLTNIDEIRIFDPHLELYGSFLSFNLGTKTVFIKLLEDNIASSERLYAILALLPQHIEQMICPNEQTNILMLAVSQFDENLEQLLDLMPAEILTKLCKLNNSRGENILQVAAADAISTKNLKLLLLKIPQDELFQLLAKLDAQARYKIKAMPDLPQEITDKINILCDDSRKLLLAQRLFGTQNATTRLQQLHWKPSSDIFHKVPMPDTAKGTTVP